MDIDMPTTDPQDEIFPVVNERGEVIGKTTRREAHCDPMLIHPVIGIFVFNPRGEMLIQKRSATKDTDPHHWTISVGGHMRYGDTPVEAAMREAREEIGLDAKPERLRLLGETLIRGSRESEYWYGYRYDMETLPDLTPHPEEVAEIKFVSLSELGALIGNPAVAWSEDPKALILKYILRK